ncbi:hypothetical protein N0V93_007423 [Gnomoniopsis smithogilvyi]|uniref:Uncharacterized protein n=1 Tax=Gnomoniopsis smithogilvyi TaxID=1191159 RepID=A0A9W8YQF2_9PEZI|nr:hypothetical protein N0V93_007423 [Gnomoniopsis smithogilvyi]
MSSSSDDRVSDHGRQIVESIEPIEDVKMGDACSSNFEHRDMSSNVTASRRTRKVKSEPLSADESEEGSGSRSSSVLSEEVTDTRHSFPPISTGDDLQSVAGSDSPKKFRPGLGRKVAGIKGDGVSSADDDELPRIQIPPSYQVPAEIESEFSSHASDDNESTDSTDSTSSQVEEDSLLRDATLSKERSRKRKNSSHGIEKQALDGSADLRPLKKTKQNINRLYLDVLNQDIEYAASQGCPIDHETMDGRAALPSSQIGLTFWTSVEKERFFEALGRLGRDNTSGIAARIHTKGELEVRQYLKILQDAVTLRRRQNELDPIGLEEFPAAMEISQECCEALDEVADNIATKEERAEVAAEEGEFGPDWLVSNGNCKHLEAEAEDDISKPAGIFRLRQWLSLPERFFMNAPTAEGNWKTVDGHAPSLRLTTLNEFRLLVLTLTKRLVAASHYMALTRVRAERSYRQVVREFVRSKDVQAAALSLGLATQKPPLTGCVRRLGLSVYEKPPKPDEVSDLFRMSVSDVEETLGIDGPRRVNHVRHRVKRIALSDSDDSSISSDSPVECGSDSDGEGNDESASDDDYSQVGKDVKDEADEAILYSAVDPPQTKRDRQALYRRIKAEREQERYADAVDAQKSYHEEIRMWELLGQQPQKSLVDPGTPSRGRRLNLSVDTGYSVGRDWRAQTKVASEWEAQYLSIN